MDTTTSYRNEENRIRLPKPFDHLDGTDLVLQSKMHSTTVVVGIQTLDPPKGSLDPPNWRLLTLQNAGVWTRTKPSSLRVLDL